MITHFKIVSLPLGFTTLTKSGLNLAVKYQSADTISRRIENLDFEIQVLERKLKGGKIFPTLNIHFVESKRLSESNRTSFHNEMQKLQEERVFLQSYSKWNFMTWNLSSLLLTAMNILFPAYFVLRVLMKALFKGFIDYYMHLGSFQVRFHVLINSSGLLR